MQVWRVGWHKAPCDFPPPEVYAWNNRFDDPDRKYRTLYCADEKKTCLREVLADFRPDTKAVAEYQKFFGVDAEAPFGHVTADWRKKNVLAKAEVVLVSGTWADVESVAMRRDLKERLAAFLAAEGVKHLDLHELRGKNRRVTKKISRTLFGQGHAGIKFRSRLDERGCYALFETRAKLKQSGASVPLAGSVPEFMAVCKEFGLKPI